MARISATAILEIHVCLSFGRSMMNMMYSAMTTAPEAMIMEPTTYGALYAMYGKPVIDSCPM